MAYYDLLGWRRVSGVSAVPEQETKLLTLSEAAERLGAKSRNAYARYEQGRCVPTVEKLDELLRAVAPNRDIVVREADAA